MEIFVAIAIISILSWAATFFALTLIPEPIINLLFQFTYSFHAYRFGERILDFVRSLLELFEGKPGAQAQCFAYMATLCSCDERYDDAEVRHKKALLIYRQLLASTADRETVHSYVLAAEDYASLLEQTGRKSEAASMLTTAATALETHDFVEKAALLIQRAESLHR